jgi:hypothetical protein
MRGECRVRREEIGTAMEAGRAAFATLLSELLNVVSNFLIDKMYTNIPFAFTKYVSS